MSETTINICRFCLCKCKKSINILSTENFIEKTKDVFYKLNLEISEENGLPFVVCVVCYNTIDQFHSYFITVAENQDKLTSELEEMLEESCSVKDNYEEWQETVEEVGNYIEVNDENDSNEEISTKNIENLWISEENIQRIKEGASLDATLREKFSKEQLFICDFCNFYTFDKQRIESHLFECKDSWELSKESYKNPTPKELLTIQCPLCPSDALKMKNDRVLQLHLKEHADYERIDRERLERGFLPLIPCPKCERRLRTEAEFQLHLKKHEKDELMTCELCGRTTVTSNLRSHLRNHFKKIICEFCSKTFKNPGGLQKHIQAKHNGPEHFVCDRCNTKIRRELKFKEHLAVCRGPGTVWPCIHCGETFESNSHRHYHVKKFHIGYKCKTCGIETKSVTALKHHYKSETHRMKSQEKRADIAHSKLTKNKGGSMSLKRR
ncbi:histone-lysine N-methyltransferase PRDM16-like [Culicoides brevitarsis]|uniref:histone-lysine N-methyltransferase PRDM16-like n=1 Tax=Culicoides brevitarsis TaxID=469753 RepID=UPI00307CA6A6